ncbi:MAG: hypothetical protein QG567_2325 [Campylobacterota bacterium]|nr:hypothetical protein [Campylobacterota bacterium]
MKTKLIQEIKQKLGIDGGVFIDAEIESYIDEIPESKYIEFFKALSGEHGFLKPIDRVAKVARQFKTEAVENLLVGTREQAKAMYDKFYAESAYMLDYCTDNRSRIPNDRAFFEGLDYTKLKKVDGSNAYTKQELYVLGELGYGSFLIDMRFYDNSGLVVERIEKIIKDAMIKKYDTAQIAPISKNVSALLNRNSQNLNKNHSNSHENQKLG